MAEDFKYDVFISHSSKDKTAVRELAERLKADNLHVWFDEWEIQPGDMIGLKVSRGLEQSRILLLVMSSNASDSEWVTFESQTILFNDPTNQQRRFIPLLLDDFMIRDTLKQFAYVDWRDNSEDQYSKLLFACRLQDSVKSSVNKNIQPPKIKIFRGHTKSVGGIAMTADGKNVVSGSGDNTLKIWEMETGKCLATFEGHTSAINGIAITADGKKVVSGSDDSTVKVWDIEAGKCLSTFKGHKNGVWGVAITPDGKKVVSGAGDNTVKVWDIEMGKRPATFSEYPNAVWAVAITTDGKKMVLGSGDSTVKVREIETGKRIATFRGHKMGVWGVAITADDKRVVSGSIDSTVKIWELETGKCLATFEGHTAAINSVAITADGKKVVSGSSDNTVRLWEVDTGKCLAIFKWQLNSVNSVAITADGKKVVSGSSDNTLKVWAVETKDEKVSNDLITARYTNAKVLLVGDSGVGKSGLAMRLTEDHFEATISTDAVWATQLALPIKTNKTNIHQEIWLWDFAGQADYRLIHQLFMDETSLAVLVFNPQSENPFEGLGQWDYSLQRAARRIFKKLLVAGRCDRGGVIISQKSIEQFYTERGFAGYLETSAQTGIGCSELRDAIIHNIDWESIPWTASPFIFQLLKKEIIALKDEGKVLLRMGELKQQIEMRLTTESFTLEQLKAVVGLLAGPGIVWQLGFGDFVLLYPERINSYAAAVVRKVRSHTEEIGVISEEDVLSGNLDYQDMKRLPPDEEQIVLLAMHQTFINHSLCLRELTEHGTLLVFPSYFKRERPELAHHPSIFVTYQFNGQLDEVYSTLIVRLHHTPLFDKADLWRFAADFKTLLGKRVGLKMTKRGEGNAEIAVYFESQIADDTKVAFIRYVHEHLKLKGNDVVRFRHYVCPHCSTPVENRKTALDRLQRGLKDILCVNCEKRVPLWDIIEEKFASEALQQQVRNLEEQSKVSIDNESKELILVGHAFAIAGEAGQIFRPTHNSDWGIDGEIEFKNNKGEASGIRVYLQLKSGDSYLQKQKTTNKEIFTIKNSRQAEYWQAQAYPVMLVIRNSNGEVRWMNVTEYLSQYLDQNGKNTRQVVFDGEPFTALNVLRLKNKLLQ